MARLIDPNSVVFLMNESKSQPMHVGGLQLFEQSPGSPPSFIRERYEDAIAATDLGKIYRTRPEQIGGIGPWAWVEDKSVDLEYHVRHIALPRPGRIRELLEIVSHQHEVLLTRERPMWEIHVIEGLDDGRFAIYSKIHHSLVDGISAMRMLQQAGSPDPDLRGMPFPFEAAAQAKRTRPAVDKELVSPQAFTAALTSGLGIAAEAAGMPGAVIKALGGAARGQTSPFSFGAPRTPMNGRISGSRRFAADSWPIDRIRAVGKATGTTLNDVVLAMCGGALRAYLKDDLGALPKAPLVAMVPVALSSRSAASQAGGGGNAVGSIMVKLGTDTDDSAVRLTGIHESMQKGKAGLGSMTPTQILAVSGLGMLPAVAMPMLHLDGFTRPLFNTIISNVPGPKEHLYFNGAKMTDIYPVSIPMHGIALNITCNSYADDLGFGLTGCRRSLPHLQRLLGHLESELAALEEAAGIG